MKIGLTGSAQPVDLFQWPVTACKGVTGHGSACLYRSQPVLAFRPSPLKIFPPSTVVVLQLQNSWGGSNVPRVRTCWGPLELLRELLQWPASASRTTSWSGNTLSPIPPQMLEGEAPQWSLRGASGAFRRTSRLRGLTPSNQQLQPEQRLELLWKSWYLLRGLGIAPYLGAT